MKNKTKGDELYRTMFVIWGAMLLSQFLFLVVGYTSKPALLYMDISKPVLGAEPLPILIIGVIALSLAAASFVVRKQLTAKAIGSKDIEKLLSAHITGMAMAEGVSFLGLFAAFLFDFQYFVIFLLLAALTIFLHRPKMASVLAVTFEDKI